MIRTRFILSLSFIVLILCLLWPINGSSREKRPLHTPPPPPAPAEALPEEYIERNQGSEDSQVELTPEDIRKGKMLFTGEVSFVNGGPPCIDCHNAGKSFLSRRINGPDLDKFWDDNVNKNELLNEKWINNFKTHIKTPVYSDRDVTHEELKYIKTYLRKPEEEIEKHYNGEGLFTGRKALKNNGTPCTSCHNALNKLNFQKGSNYIYEISNFNNKNYKNGGIKGPDLMLPNEKYGVGPAPVNPLIAAAWINSAGTPVMGPIYSNRNVTEEEVEYLKEFFKSIEGKGRLSNFAITGRKLFTGELSFVNGGTSCVNCHSVGNGMFDRGIAGMQNLGPELKDNYYSNMTIEWINNANVHTNQPVYSNKKINNEEIQDITFYIKTKFIDAYDFNKGGSLFIGELGLKNGGPACISCHSAGKWAEGVETAINLMLPNEEYGVGPAPVNPLIAAAWINSASTPVMGPIYSKMNITDEEVDYLRAFFKSLPFDVE